MYSVLVLNPVNADPATDTYGEGMTLGTPATLALSDLDVGSIALVKSDGEILDRTANAGAIADEDFAGNMRNDQLLNFVTRTANGLQKGVHLTRGLKYYLTEYSTPVAQEETLTVSAPTELAPFVGQYASIHIIDVDAPEWQMTRQKPYSVIVNETNYADIDTVMGELEDAINNDPDAIVTVVYAAGVFTFTAKVAGKRFAVKAEDIIRDSVAATTQEPVSGPPTSEIAEAEINRSSQEGININKMASELYNVVRSTNPALTYSVFVIESTNNIGSDKGVQFPLTQTIAVPTTCTLLIDDLTALLDYLSESDVDAVWGGA